MIFIFAVAVTLALFWYLFKFAKFSMISIESKLGVNNPTTVALCFVGCFVLQAVAALCPPLFLPASAGAIGCILIVWKYAFYWIKRKATGQSDDMIEYFKWKAERKKETIDESSKSKQR